MVRLKLGLGVEYVNSNYQSNILNLPDGARLAPNWDILLNLQGINLSVIFSDETGINLFWRVLKTSKEIWISFANGFDRFIRIPKNEEPISI